MLFTTHKRLFLVVIAALFVILLAGYGCGGYDEDDTGTQDGDLTDGDTQDGDSEDGDVEDGDTQDGDTADGDNTDGDTEDGDTEDGDTEDGDTEDGDVEDGDIEDGDIPDYPPGPYGYTFSDLIENFKLNDCDGNPVELKDFFGDAKAILLNSSAGWCSVCRRETPSLQEWYEELKDEGLVVIQTLFEDNSGRPSTESFCRSWRDNDFKLTYVVLNDPRNYFIDYHPEIQAGGVSYATPLNMILDRNMRIQYINEGDIPHTIYDRIQAVLDNE